MVYAEEDVFDAQVGVATRRVEPRPGTGLQLHHRDGNDTRLVAEELRRVVTANPTGRQHDSVAAPWQDQQVIGDQ